MSNLKYSVGLDVAQQNVKACISLINSEQQVKIKASRTFDNNEAGFTALYKWVSKHVKEALPVTYVMEATGVYYEPLAWFLYEHNCSCSVLLPNYVKSYLQSIGLKSKNDSLDAQGLARMGAERYLSQWQPLSRTLYVLRSLTRLHESLSGQRTALNNQLHATEYRMYDLKAVRKGLQATLKAIDKQLKVTEEQIRQLIMDDEQLKGKYDKISGIKGIGVLSFAVIVAETNGFALFDNQRQLVSYAGYDVVENQSGKRIGKTRISKRGNARIRRILHMPALCAIRYQEPALKALYERVYQRTGIKMKGYVAVQKKMLCLIYALWKKDQPYDPAHYCCHGNCLQKNSTSSNNEPKTNRQEFFIKSGYEHIKISTEDIRFIKSDADYTEVFASGKKYLSSEPLRNWLENLNHHQFVRIHKSYIINISKIEKIVGNQVYLMENTVIPIGRAYKDSFIQKFIR